MNILLRRMPTIFLICASAFILFLPKQAIAVLSSCSANVSPQTITMSTAQRYVFTFDSVSTIQWIQITRPSANFTITSATAEGWNASTSSDAVTFALGGSGSTTLNVDALSGDTEIDATDWSVTASDDPGGADAIACDGVLDTTISGAGADMTAPTISAIVVSDITDTSAKITWTTDESSSTSVDYGTSDEYGSASTGSSGVTSHEVTVSGLSANTTYHYNVLSTDGSSNIGESGDNTFATAKSGYTGTTVTGTVTTTTVTRTISATPTPTPMPDRSPPIVSITTKLEKVYTAPPEISGRASDPSGVASVEYSLDGGINFLPVDEMTNPGKSSIVFHVIPYQTDDGNYSLVFRSTDLKGNSGKTKGTTIIIDRIPPQFGTYLISMGPQSIDPQNGIIHILQNTEYLFTVSAVGGPTSVKLTVENNKREVAEVLSQKNPDTGLWHSTLHFQESGDYVIYGNALDGAENKTIRKLADIQVEPLGIIQNVSGKPVPNAVVSMYVLDNHTNQFVLWDGASYGQRNPLHPKQDGKYGIVVPPGMYYMTITAPSYRTLRSDIITISQVSAIATNLTLEQKRGIRVGSWVIPFFDFSQTRVTIEVQGKSLANLYASGAQKGEELPFFRFPYESGFISSLDLRGKPTIISFFNTWAPIAASEITVLDELAKMPEINVIGIVPQESTASVATYRKRGGYEVRLLADPDGQLVTPLHIGVSPTHVIVNRKGVIQSVIQGLVTKEEVLDTINK